MQGFEPWVALVLAAGFGFELAVSIFEWTRRTRNWWFSLVLGAAFLIGALVVQWDWK
jgi:hypothetical protein